MAQANLDPSQINFRNLADSGDSIKGGNFLAFLPEILTSITAAPASWMSLPELSFLQNGNFKQAHERQARLAPFSQRNNSVLVLPFSLPKVLANLLNWEPPKLFAQENLQRVPTSDAINFQSPVAYHFPDSEREPNLDNAAEISPLLSETVSLESMSNMEALGTLNFPDPRSGTSQQLSRQINNTQ
jgi:hypothetical protein